MACSSPWSLSVAQLSPCMSVVTSELSLMGELVPPSKRSTKKLILLLRINRGARKRTGHFQWQKNTSKSVKISGLFWNALEAYFQSQFEIQKEIMKHLMMGICLLMRAYYVQVYFRTFLWHRNRFFLPQISSHLSSYINLKLVLTILLTSRQVR